METVRLEWPEGHVTTMPRDDFEDARELGKALDKIASTLLRGETRPKSIPPAFRRA